MLTAEPGFQSGYVWPRDSSGGSLGLASLTSAIVMVSGANYPYFAAGCLLAGSRASVGTALRAIREGHAISPTILVGRWSGLTGAGPSLVEKPRPSVLT